jgi:hypothetical protein
LADLAITVHESHNHWDLQAHDLRHRHSIEATPNVDVHLVITTSTAVVCPLDTFSIVTLIHSQGTQYESVYMIPNPNQQALPTICYCTVRFYFASTNSLSSVSVATSSGCLSSAQPTATHQPPFLLHLSHSTRSEDLPESRLGVLCHGHMTLAPPRPEVPYQPPRSLPSTLFFAINYFNSAYDPLQFTTFY